MQTKFAIIIYQYWNELDRKEYMLLRMLLRLVLLLVLVLDSRRGSALKNFQGCCYYSYHSCVNAAHPFPF